MLVFARLQLGKTLTIYESILWVTISLGAASLTYSAIEKPIDQLFRLNGKITACSLAFLLFGVSALSWSLNNHAKVGDLGRISTSVENNFSRDIMIDQACLSLTGLSSNLKYCRTSKIPFGPTIALIGDSHANRLFAGLSRLYEKKSLGIVALGTDSCPAFVNLNYHNEKYVDSSQCVAVFKSIVEYILKTESIKTVIISSFFRNLAHFQISEDDTKIDWREKQKNIAQILNKFIFNIEKSGRNVIVIIDNPQLSIDPHMCLTRNWRKIDLKQNCKILADDPSVNWQYFYSQIKPSVCVFDGSSPLMQIGYATVSDDKSTFFSDSNHLNFEGSLRFAKVFENSSCFSFSL